MNVEFDKSLLVRLNKCWDEREGDGYKKFCDLLTKHLRYIQSAVIAQASRKADGWLDMVKRLDEHENSQMEKHLTNTM
jgi:hypothetical protein